MVWSASCLLGFLKLECVNVEEKSLESNDGFYEVCATTICYMGLAHVECWVLELRCGLRGGLRGGGCLVGCREGMPIMAFMMTCLMLGLWMLSGFFEVYDTYGHVD